MRKGKSTDFPFSCSLDGCDLTPDPFPWSTQRGKIDGARNDQGKFPGAYFSVSKCSLCAPEVAVISHRDGVVGADGQKLASHVGVVATEGRTNTSSLLQIPKVDLNAVPLKRGWLRLVHGVQLRQSLRQIPFEGCGGKHGPRFGPHGIQSPSEIEVGVSHGVRWGVDSCGIGSACRHLRDPEKPFPPRIRGGQRIVLRLARNGKPSEPQHGDGLHQNLWSMGDDRSHGSKGIRPAFSAEKERWNLCERSPDPSRDSRG